MIGVVIVDVAIWLRTRWTERFSKISVLGVVSSQLLFLACARVCVCVKESMCFGFYVCMCVWESLLVFERRIRICFLNKIVSHSSEQLHPMHIFSHSLFIYRHEFCNSLNIFCIFVYFIHFFFILLIYLIYMCFETFFLLFVTSCNCK